MNIVTPAFVRQRGLPVQPLKDILDGGLSLGVVGGSSASPTGYVIIKVGVKGVAGYEEDQIALVVADASSFSARVPVTLGTATLRRVVNVMREEEMKQMGDAWDVVRAASLGLPMALAIIGGMPERFAPFLESVTLAGGGQRRLTRLRMADVAEGDHIPPPVCPRARIDHAVL